MRISRIQRLQCLTSDRLGRGQVEQTEALCSAGARWIQFRMKRVDLISWIAVAQRVGEVCRRYGSIFVVNDSIEVASAVGADGVHLGKGDGSPLEARKRLGAEAIVGATVHDREEAVQALAGGVVDYLGIGPFRRSPTKGDFLPPLKEDELNDLLDLSGELPAVVIGGVTALDVPNLISRGAHGVAVCSGLFADPDANLKAMLADYGKAMGKAA